MSEMSDLVDSIRRKGFGTLPILEEAARRIGWKMFEWHQKQRTRKDLPTEIEKVLPEVGVHRGPVTPHKNPCEGVN